MACLGNMFFFFLELYWKKDLVYKRWLNIIRVDQCIEKNKIKPWIVRDSSKFIAMNKIKISWLLKSRFKLKKLDDAFVVKIFYLSLNKPLVINLPLWERKNTNFIYLFCWVQFHYKIEGLVMRCDAMCYVVASKSLILSFSIIWFINYIDLIQTRMCYWHYRFCLHSYK